MQLSVNMMSFLAACTDMLRLKCPREHIQLLHTLRCFSSHSERLDIDFHNKQGCQQKPFGELLKISSSLKLKSNLAGCELESTPCSHPAFISKKLFFFFFFVPVKLLTGVCFERAKSFKVLIKHM